jgi:hypothetical protein
MWGCTYCTLDAVDPENCTHVQATPTSHNRDGYDSVPLAWARDVVHAQHKSACLALNGSDWQCLAVIGSVWQCLAVIGSD